MFLVVGLGNPGKKYENTYHNVGFMALDKFANNKQIKLTKKKGQALIFEGKLENQKVIIAKPQTFMNLSGNSVKVLSNKFKIKPSNIIIIYDDVDLELGEVRFRNSGSAGTHNGMKSIVNTLSTTEIKRIRIGIGKGKGDLSNFVLSKINKSAKVYIDDSTSKACDLLSEILNSDGELENKSA